MAVPSDGLRQIILSGPQFSGMVAVGDHTGIAAALNYRSGTLAGTSGGASLSGGQVWRNDIQTREMVNVIQPADFINLSQIQISKLNVLFQGAPFDAQLSGLRQNFQNVLSGTASVVSGHVTRLALRPGSIIEAQFGTGESVTANQVQQALA